MRFEGLRLIEPVLRAVRTAGYVHPTSIQSNAIPYVLAGRDVLGCAQTGTGKTAGFALPILQRLSGRSARGTLSADRQLVRAGVRAAALHGNKSQEARTRALSGFRSAHTPVLVATDIAAHGLDVEDISHVINYDLTPDPETYVHRIGRTGRAGAAGTAMSFCTAEERGSLLGIERLLRTPLRRADNRPPYDDSVAPQPHRSGVAAGVAAAPAPFAYGVIA